MTKNNTKVELEAFGLRLTKLEQMLTRVETKLDTLLSSSTPSPVSSRLQAERSSVDQGDGDEWMEGLDGITRFNLERGWITEEEVRKTLKEG